MKKKVSRAPQGARGLKSQNGSTRTSKARRAPQGARGLKYDGRDRDDPCQRRRAPQGARGLKCLEKGVDGGAGVVAPRKGRVG